MYISTVQCYKAVNDLYQEYKSTGQTKDLWIRINGTDEEVKRTIDWLKDNFIVNTVTTGRHSSFMCSILEDILISAYKELSKNR